MITHEVEGSRACEELFRVHPEFTYLPQAAADRGFYGCFVMGISCLFFVFGYDKELIESGDFIEVFTELYAAKEYLEEHRLSEMADSNILCKRYNVVCIPYDSHAYLTGKFSWVISYMNRLETVFQLSKRFHCPMPEYFDWGGDFEARLSVCRAEVNDAYYKKTQDDAWYQLKEQFLFSCMTQPCLRPTDKNYKLIDYMNSMYYVGSDPMQSRKYLEHPEKWENRLFTYTKDYAANPFLSVATVQYDILNEFLRLMDLHQIPYRATKENTLSKESIKAFRTKYAYVVANDCNKQAVFFPTHVILFVDHLLHVAKVNSLFTAEEEKWAMDMLGTGEYYLFDCPPTKPYLLRLREAGIKFASHPNLCSDTSSNLVCVADLADKADIDAILYSASVDYSFMHTQSSISDSAVAEVRIPSAKGGVDISVCTDNPAIAGDTYMGRTFTPAKLKNHEAEEYLRKEGLLVDPLRSREYAKNQQPGICALTAGIHTVNSVKKSQMTSEPLNSSAAVAAAQSKPIRLKWNPESTENPATFATTHPEAFKGLVCDDATGLFSCTYFHDSNITISGRLDMTVISHPFIDQLFVTTPGELKYVQELCRHFTEDPDLDKVETCEAYLAFTSPKFKTDAGTYVYTQDECYWVNELLHRGFLVPCE